MKARTLPIIIIMIPTVILALLAAAMMPQFMPKDAAPAAAMVNMLNRAFPPAVSQPAESSAQAAQAVVLVDSWDGKIIGRSEPVLHKGQGFQGWYSIVSTATQCFMSYHIRDKSTNKIDNTVQSDDDPFDDFGPCTPRKIAHAISKFALKALQFGVPAELISACINDFGSKIVEGLEFSSDLSVSFLTDLSTYIK